MKLSIIDDVIILLNKYFQTPEQIREEDYDDMEDTYYVTTFARDEATAVVNNTYDTTTYSTYGDEDYYDDYVVS